MRLARLAAVSLGLGILLWPLMAWAQQNTVLSSSLGTGLSTIPCFSTSNDPYAV